MLARLKSLPLTIILTVVIWMYAESQVTLVHGDNTLTVTDVPVWVSGPPEALAQYNIAVEPQAISVSVTGTPSLIQKLRQSSAAQSGIHVYLDITDEDRPSPLVAYRAVRYVAPTGVSVLQPPELVGYRLTPKVAAATAK